MIAGMLFEIVRRFRGIGVLTSRFSPTWWDVAQDLGNDGPQLDEWNIRLHWSRAAIANPRLISAYLAHSRIESAYGRAIGHFLVSGRRCDRYCEYRGVTEEGSGENIPASVARILADIVAHFGEAGWS